MAKGSWVFLEPQDSLVYLAPLVKMDWQGFLDAKENLVELLLRVKEVPLETQGCQVSQGIGVLWALLVLDLQVQ